MVLINERNRQRIESLAHSETCMSMNVLSLMRLIERKGEPIETNDEKIKGLKALEYQDGIYIAIKDITPKKYSNPFLIQVYKLVKI